MVTRARSPRGGRTLSDVMEFDHVVRVDPDGSIADAEGSHYFELWWTEETPANTAGYELSVSSKAGVWRLMNGYSGQYSYAGPIMHSSEFIGGRMERDILETPGLYVALVCEVHDCEECVDDDGEPIPDPECHGEHEPAGWAIATIADEA